MRVTEAQQRVLGLLGRGGACIRRGRYVEYASQQICSVDTVESLVAKGLLMPIYLPEPEDKHDRWMISDEGQKWIDDKDADEESGFQETLATWEAKPHRDRNILSWRRHFFHAGYSRGQKDFNAPERDAETPTIE